LLLRLLSVRRQWLTTTHNSSSDSDNDDNGEEKDDGHRSNPAAEAAAEAGDVIVDEFDAALELMSGLEGGDDGELPDAAVVGLYKLNTAAPSLEGAWFQPLELIKWEKLV
jgi:hypothetical protein